MQKALPTGDGPCSWSEAVREVESSAVPIWSRSAVEVDVESRVVTGLDVVENLRGDHLVIAVAERPRLARIVEGEVQ